MRHVFYVFMLILCSLFSRVSLAALTVDASSDQIQITTGFNGTSITVFGTQDEEGALVLKVEGPEKTIALHEKTKVFGVWMNTKSQKFTNIPAYYALASSIPLESVTTPEILYTNRLGAFNIFSPSTRTSDAAKFAEALIRIQQERGLYNTDVKPVVYNTPVLFKAKFDLPAVAVSGTYKVSALLFKNGILTEQAQTSFDTEPIGVSASLRLFATDHRLLYGLTSVLIALLAGWLATVLLKRE